MSELFNKIQIKIKTAMVEKDNITRDCLRTIVSEVKNQTINANPPKEVTDDVCMKVLQKSAKTHMDSIEQFSKGGRMDLVEKEQTELAVIEAFLPKMLSEDETRKIIEDVLSNAQIEPLKRNMGLVMKSLPNVEGLDRKLVAKLLQGILK